MTQNRSKVDLAKRKQILGLLDSNLVILTSNSLLCVFVGFFPLTLPRAHYLHPGKTLLKYQSPALTLLEEILSSQPAFSSLPWLQFSL